jgi:hypothetical protein
MAIFPNIPVDPFSSTVETFSFEIVATYKNSSSQIKTNSFPLWYKNFTRLSLARSASNYATCASLGGQVTDDYQCLTVFKVHQVCIQVIKNKSLC